MVEKMVGLGPQLFPDLEDSAGPRRVSAFASSAAVSGKMVPCQPTRAPHGPPLYLRPAIHGDTRLILPTVRQADIDELAALGATPEQCVRQGLQLSQLATTIFLHGEPAGVVGIIDYGEYKLPWAVLTTAIERYPVPFLRASRAWIGDLTGFLMNYVDARNQMTIRWLQWLGFSIDEPVPYGLNGQPFSRFWRA